MLKFHCYFILVFVNFFLSLYQPPKEALSYGVFCRNFLLCLQSPTLTIPVTCSLSQTVTRQRKKPLSVWFIKPTAVTGCLRLVLGRWLLPFVGFFNFFYHSCFFFLQIREPVATATTTKKSFEKWIRAASNWIALISSCPCPIRQMLADFFWSWILKNCHEVLKKKKKVIF